MSLPTEAQVAREFCVQLERQIGSARMDAVRWRNSREREPNVCHSHDFTDANMAMHAAFEAFEVEVDVRSVQQLALWNGAWDLAKAAHFDRHKIPD